MSDLPGETPSVWGPDSRFAGVSVTFDNLGEAADLERGQWPENEPLGRHFSVKRTLPRILDTLEELALRATFFVEGINAELYSDALLEISNSGHELGYHGWRHEFWPNLSPSNEARLLERGVRKMDELGVRPRGFRPPGGRLTPSSPELLESLGFTHCSPAGVGIGFLGNLVVLPFEWRLIDAYFYLPRFGGLRETATGSSESLHPGQLPGDAKLGAAGRRPRRRAPNPGVPSLPGRTGRSLWDYARSARGGAGLNTRWAGLVRTVPGCGLMGPGTPRGFRQWAPARPY